MRRRLVLALAAWSVAPAAWSLGCASAPEAPSATTLAAERAAETARTAYAERQWSAAARGFGRAADAYAALDENGPEAAARRSQAESLRRAGDAAAAEEAGAAALAIDRQLGSPEDVARDLAGLARSAAARGDGALARARAEEALSLAPPGTPLAALLENDLAVYLLTTGDAGDRARAESLLGAALSGATARGDAAAVAAAALNLGRAALASGDPAAAAPRLERALAGYRGLEDPEGIASCHEALAALARARGDETLAAYHLGQARAGFRFLDDRAALSRLDGESP